MRVRTGRFRKRKQTSSSGVTLRAHPERTDTDQAPRLQPRIRHPGLRRQRPRQVPVALATDRREDGGPLARAQRQKVSHLGTHLLVYPCSALRRNMATATTASADFCPFTRAIARTRALRALPRVRWRFHPFRNGPQSGSRREHRAPSGQISPNKNMRLRCTTAAFTLPLDLSGFVILC